MEADALPATALTVATPAAVDEVSVASATPPTVGAVVVAVLPKAPLSVANRTLVPSATGSPAAVTTHARSRAVELPSAAISDGTAVRVTTEGPGVGEGVGVLALGVAVGMGVQVAVSVGVNSAGEGVDVGSAGDGEGVGVH